MDILDRDLQEIDLQKQEAYRLTATCNQETGEKFFDWTKVLQDGNIMLHASLLRLRKRQLPEDQKEKLQEILPPLVLAVNKDDGEKSLHFATDDDKTEENIKKVDEMKSRIYAEFEKFSVRFLEKGKFSTFDYIATREEQQSALWDSIPDEELFKSPKTVHEGLLRKEILEARMHRASGYEKARYRHFLGYD